MIELKVGPTIVQLSSERDLDSVEDVYSLERLSTLLPLDRHAAMIERNILLALREHLQLFLKVG